MELLSTKEVARLLDINEKMVYSLITEKGLPGTKVTGKWLFPRHQVEQWIESNTANLPELSSPLPPYHGLLIIAGSNDLLLERALTLFNRLYPKHAAVFGNLGSMGGIDALGRNLCHMATCHLLQENESEYNFDFAASHLQRDPAIVNFCKREQGLLIAKGNPKKIEAIGELDRKDISIVNRPPGTGTRLLLDRELEKAGVKTGKVRGYDRELSRHLDVGLEILAGRADAGMAIRAVAGVLNLGFIPVRWERYDLMIKKERFFDQGVQYFLGMLHEPAFQELTETLEGYDIRLSGKMVFPQNGN